MESKAKNSFLIMNDGTIEIIDPKEIFLKRDIIRDYQKV